MKSIRTQDAVGHALLHDLVRIVIGEVKDTPFRRGHVITDNYTNCESLTTYILWYCDQSS